ncbi:unnamed protein product [Symbiodinium sp. CCMP2592]|nr:unnamed protein product [Symbiodinium sp. CCMP2592]
MSKKLEKSISAAQKFLTGLRTLPQFPEIQSRQAANLRKAAEGIPVISVSESTTILETLDENLWNPEWLEDFRSLVASKTGDDESTGRAGQQDYTLLPKYLTAEIWQGLLQPDEHLRETMLEQLCKHAARLGLRNPTEASNATILALVWGLTSSPELTVHGMADLLKKKRAVIKKFLQASGKCSLQLMALPLDLVDLPREFLQLAFGGKTPAAAREEAKLASMLAVWPLRGNNKVLQRGMASLDLGSASVSRQMSGSDFGHFAAAFASTWAASQATGPGAAASSAAPSIEYLEPAQKRQRLLALKDQEPEDRPLPAPLPSTEALPNTSAAKADPPVALEEPSSGADRDLKEQAAEPTAKPLHVSSVLDDLRSVAKQGQKPLKGKPACNLAAAKTSPCKKPAAQVLRRPAAQSSAASSDDKFAHHNFHAQGYGDCRVEFFSNKSYIRSWDYSQGKYVMVMGSCAAGIHKDICHALLPHVKKGVSREKLWDIREDLMKKFSASA